ncbi:hypothetical protein GUITHDRAFT_110696 [Guillardia theta CCMP2712]|uniref:Cation/H+ exchanger transmembrane domain-containing protein n=1 Tax=Guillardia theta (strain CCMP2712) TaxID=905079 RepID=L1J4Q6_GUITC|nr:hypothetical protein GUITHDRAFT_110696 [Guillardia theta CCMP2712]EKX43282.1 hypothetical protein GUITHDRAFT_110696 [Guillardia theta CCMP2712]|eukprot:XP_005830262.1 hypothetical protein GUITHDRAFT_110696 [Guillardia theta CCMP2712]
MHRGRGAADVMEFDQLRSSEADATAHATVVDVGQHPVTLPFGMMLIALGVLSVLFHFAKQSNIIACIIIGAVVGAMGWDQDMYLSKATSQAFIELGIMWIRLVHGRDGVLINGFGQIALNFAVFAGLAAGTGTTKDTVATVYFGLACTFSSTILVLGALKSRGEMETSEDAVDLWGAGVELGVGVVEMWRLLHGQIILGLMVLQDITAVLALSILSGFDKSVENPPPIGQVIGVIIGELIAIMVVLIFLNKFVLTPLFRLFAVNGEMLFIGTFAYALGVAGICSQFGLAEIGAFYAGVSVAALPYRLQIETKVEPIKAFGVVLFFFILGIDLHLTPEGLREAAPMAVAVALLTVFVLPSLMWLCGMMAGVDGRSAFLIGNTINQVSEFSLIIASLAKGYGVFDEKIFMIITLGTLITLLLSSSGHVLADQIYGKISCLLYPLDKWCRVKEEAEEAFLMEQHVVLLGFNEAGFEVAEFFRKRGKDVLCIHLDASLHETFQRMFVLGQAARDVGGGGEGGGKKEEGEVSAEQVKPMFEECMEDGKEGEEKNGEEKKENGKEGEEKKKENGKETRKENGKGGGKEEGKDVENPLPPSSQTGSNIYSQYADPENPESWHHYSLHSASLVVSCLQDRTILLLRPN